MALYDFECSNCQFSDEIVQSMNEPSLRYCPKCGEYTFQKLFAPTHGQIHGLGNMRTVWDFARKKRDMMTHTEIEHKEQQMMRDNFHNTHKKKRHSGI
jgi:putative FmdB family regulatory protein